MPTFRVELRASTSVYLDVDAPDLDAACSDAEDEMYDSVTEVDRATWTVVGVDLR